MNKIIKLIFLILFSSMHVSQVKPGILSNIYGLILGNKDVSEKYIQMVHRALEQLEAQDASSVTVKQMNTVGSKLALQDLSSFTAFGIWLDQKYLNTLGEEERTFLLYHEASHYVQKHHPKTILACVFSLLLLTAELLTLKTGLASSHPLLQSGALTLAGLLSILAWYRYLLPYLIKRQEKQADLMATQALIDSGAQHIVDAHIEALKASKNPDNGGLWWYSDKEIARYLEELKTTIVERKPKGD